MVAGHTKAVRILVVVRTAVAVHSRGLVAVDTARQDTEVARAADSRHLAVAEVGRRPAFRSGRRKRCRSEYLDVAVGRRIENRS